MPFYTLANTPERIERARTTAEALKITSLQIFWDQLNRFDWDYDMTDDHGVFMAAREQREALDTVATLSPEHRAMFSGFSLHHAIRNSRNPEIALPPLPIRPEGEAQDSGPNAGASPRPALHHQGQRSL